MEANQAQETELPPPPENTPESVGNVTPVIDRQAEADLIRAAKGPVNKWLEIPPRFQGKTLATLEGLRPQIAAGDAALREKKSIFITGACGTGKTHLALGLLLEWCAIRWMAPNANHRLWQCARFVPWVEVLMEIKKGFDDGYTEWQLLNRYTEFDMLVIDDLGAERVSEWSKSECYAIIDRRYRAVKQTIVTSNLSLDQIAKVIDDRISSRLVEMGRVIQLKGEDYRLKGIEAETKKGKVKK